MGFSRQEYLSGLPFPSPGDLPGIKLVSPALAGGFFTTELHGKPLKLPHYLVIPFLGVYPEELKSGSQGDVCTLIPVAALFPVAKI